MRSPRECWESKECLPDRISREKINIQEAKCTEEADSARASAKETNWECLSQQRKMKEDDVEVQPVKS